MTLRSAALIGTSSANEPGPVNPGCVCCGHTCASPAKQNVQRPPHLGDYARELVSRHMRQGHRVVPLPGVPVRPAYAGGVHFDEHTVGRARGLPHRDKRGELAILPELDRPHVAHRRDRGDFGVPAPGSTRRDDEQVYGGAMTERADRGKQG